MASAFSVAICVDDMSYGEIVIVHFFILISFLGRGRKNIFSFWCKKKKPENVVDAE